MQVMEGATVIKTFQTFVRAETISFSSTSIVHSASHPGFLTCWLALLSECPDLGGVSGCPQSRGSILVVIVGGV